MGMPTTTQSLPSCTLFTSVSIAIPPLATPIIFSLDPYAVPLIPTEIWLFHYNVIQHCLPRNTDGTLVYTQLQRVTISLCEYDWALFNRTMKAIRRRGCTRLITRGAMQ